MTVEVVRSLPDDLSPAELVGEVGQAFRDLRARLLDRVPNERMREVVYRKLRTAEASACRAILSEPKTASNGAS